MWIIRRVVKKIEILCMFMCNYIVCAQEEEQVDMGGLI